MCTILSLSLLTYLALLLSHSRLDLLLDVQHDNTRGLNDCDEESPDENAADMVRPRTKASFEACAHFDIWAVVAGAHLLAAVINVITNGALAPALFLLDWRLRMNGACVRVCECVCVCASVCKCVRVCASEPKEVRCVRSERGRWSKTLRNKERSFLLERAYLAAVAAELAEAAKRETVDDAAGRGADITLLGTFNFTITVVVLSLVDLEAHLVRLTLVVRATVAAKRSWASMILGAQNVLDVIKRNILIFTMHKGSLFHHLRFFFVIVVSARFNSTLRVGGRRD